MRDRKPRNIGVVPETRVRAGRLAVAYRMAGVVLCLALAGTAGGQDLVGYWKFDEGSDTTAADESGNGYTGTLNGGIGWTTGRYGSGLQFDGATGYVLVACDPGEKLDIVGDFTLAAWVKLDTDAAAPPDHGAIARWNDACTVSLRISHDGQLHYNYYGTTWYDIADSGYLRATPGEWHHVAYTLDHDTGDGEAMGYCYIDGEYSGSILCSDPPSANAGAFMIGGVASQQYFKGVLDEIMVYEGLLSQAEIQGIMDPNVFVSVSASNPDATEGPAGTETGSFTVTRTGTVAAQFPLTVGFELDGTATKPTETDPDYELSVDPAEGSIDVAAGLFDFAADVTELVVTVGPADDGNGEPDETVVFRLVAGMGYSLDAGSEEATVTIADDDAPPGAFDLSSPADGWQDQPLAPTLAWGESAGALRYVVIVADNASLDSPIIEETLLVSELADAANPSYEVFAGTFGYTATYHWTVKAQNDSVPGETNAGPAASWSFTTKADNDPPTVLGAKPRDGAESVEAYDAVQIYFNEEMEPVSAEGAFSLRKDGAAEDVVGTFNWTNAGNTLVFTPEEKLDWQTGYTITIDGSAADASLAGNLLDGAPYVFTFTTAEALVGLATGDGCAPGAGTLSPLALALAALALTGTCRRRSSAGMEA